MKNKNIQINTTLWRLIILCTVLVLIGGTACFLFSSYELYFKTIPQGAAEWIFAPLSFGGVEHVALEDLPVELQIKKIFGEDSQIALAIAKAESNLNCNARSKTSDSGLFQINEVHQRRGWTEEQMNNCTENIKMAKLLFDEQGWTPWVSYTSGAYKRFLQ